MTQHTFPVSENTRIQIRNCANRVVVTGWDDARTVATDCDARQESDTLIIENIEKVTVRIPRALSVLIADCDADVRVDDLTGSVELANIDGDIALRNLRGETLLRDIDGDLSARDIVSLHGQGQWQGDIVLRDVESSTIAEIDGDVNLRSIGAATIQKISGDLSVVGNRAALNIDEVEGDVNLGEVNGRVAIQHAGDDFIASEVKNALDLPDIDGDAVISFAQAVELKLVAKGDVILRLPSNSNAEIELDAPRGDLIARQEMQIVKQDDHFVRGTIGNGGIKIQAESTHGDLILEGDPSMRHMHDRPMHRHFAQMGHAIAEEVRQSVRASLVDLPMANQHRRHRFEIRMHDQGDDTGAWEESTATFKPALSETERKAILDAIGRGELSVDEGIKKLRGEA